MLIVYRHTIEFELGPEHQDIIQEIHGLGDVALDLVATDDVEHEGVGRLDASDVRVVVGVV